MTNKKLKKSILILTGCFLGVFISEIFAYIFLGAPPDLNTDHHFNQAYIDIYENIVHPDKNKKYYIKNKPDYKIKPFSYIKAEKEKRVFIIGESVARRFRNNYLESKLESILPQYSWVVRNFGLGGYESYRITIVLKEIARYKPDLILLFMGNNDGMHNPVKINYLPYKYKILSRFWTTRIITERLCPPEFISFDNSKSNYVNNFFKNNLIKMIKLSKNIAPLMVYTLPDNHQLTRIIPYPYHDKIMFTAWWLIDNNPEKAIRKYSSLFNENHDPRLNWYLAQAYGKIGNHKKAAEFYRKNIFEFQVERNNIIRDAAETHHLLFVDFRKIIHDLTDGNPGFDYFSDIMHYWPPVYRIISDATIKNIYKHNINNKINVLANPSEWNTDSLNSINIDEILDLNKQFLESDSVRLFHLSRGLFWKPWKDFELHKGKLKIYYQNDPDFVITLDQNEQILETAEKHPEQWPGALCIIGEALREKKDLKNALKYFNKAVVLDKDLYYLYLFRGLCHFDMNKKNSAERDFKRLRELNKDYRWLSMEYLEKIRLNDN